MTQSENFMLGGGLDTVTPYLMITPGKCRDIQNYEPGLEGGYVRIEGLERFDGQPSPHLQNYTALELADSSAVSVGDTITGVTSGATADVVAIDSTTDIIAVVKVASGPFQEESITVTTITDVLGEGLGPDALDATWKLAAQDDYRLDIAKVPGSGTMRGVWGHDGVEYAFRDNAGATETDMYKSTAAGWVQVTFDNLLYFDAGSGTAFAVGDTVTGLASGASADVLAVVKYIGTWGTDAEGYLVLDTIAGGPYQDNEALQVAAATAALAKGVNAAITLAPGGDYQFISHNFYASATTYNMYGCDGVNPGFMFDGTTYVPILLPNITGAPALNTPFLIFAHKGHLFLAFPNGSVQASVQGEPITFSGFLGAAEFGLGAEITNFEAETGELLVIDTERQTYGLYGNNITDWNLSLLSSDTGAVIYTSQRLGATISLDDRGITYLPRTAAYGNFEAGTISRVIQPLVDSKKATATKSVVVRKKNQYRLFFEDGTFIIAYATQNDQEAPFHFAKGDLGMVVRTVCNVEDENGAETIYFGSDDGYIYQMEVGINFDGEEIESWLLLPFNPIESPRRRKRFRRAHFDMAAEGSVTFAMSSEIHSGEPSVLPPAADSQVVFGGAGGYWDVDNWESVFWDAQTLADVRYDLTGRGTNINFTIYNKSAITESFNIHSVELDYDMGRRDR